MAYEDPRSGSLKRKRRRRDDRPAVPARLYLDSSLKGEVGLVSEGVAASIWPDYEKGELENDTKFLAVTLSSSQAQSVGTPWTILPFRVLKSSEKQSPQGSLRFPVNAIGTQSFVSSVQAVSPNKNLRQNAPIEVLACDVAPLPLETIYVAVDVGALQKLEEVQRRFGGGALGGNALGKKAVKRDVLEDSQRPTSQDGEERRKQLVQAALDTTSVVHSGDFLPLDLKHTMTHAPAPPAKVLACEPVSQGTLTASTKVVLVPSNEKHSKTPNGRALLSPRLPEESGEDEDTANEAFYSAAESPNKPAKPVTGSKAATDMSNTDDLFDSSTEDSNLSDDDDEMISLATPGLLDRPSGLSSAISGVTPRPFGSRANGVSTPGSVFSHMSSSTVRGGQSSRSKTFRAQGLLQRISEQQLHPKPSSDEDDEARVYVDAPALARLGCFSGDWVKIEATNNEPFSQLQMLGSLQSGNGYPWRPVKIYSLPEHLSKKPPRYQINTRGGRRDSISSLATNTGSAAALYMSPILLANLKQPSHVSISPLMLSKLPALKRPTMPRPGSMSTGSPPTATEVRLRKVVTPLSNHRALDSMLFNNLKAYFEEKRRLAKSGDLIAVTIDESLGKAMYAGPGADDEIDYNNLMAQFSGTGEKGASESGGCSAGVAWFHVEEVKMPPSEDDDEPSSENNWPGAALIDPSKTTMRQSGDDKRKLPSINDNTWQYYLGARQISVSPMQSTSTGVPEAPPQHISSTQRRLRELISVSVSPRAIQLQMEPLALLLTSTQRSIGKAYTVERVCADLGLHFCPIDAYDIASEGGAGVDTQTQALLEARCERALQCGAECTAICIQHIETLNDERVHGVLKSILGQSRVLIATTTASDKMSDSIRGLFTHEIEMTAPDESDREGILRDIITESKTPLSPEVNLSSIAVKTAALVAGDLLDVVERAIEARTRRLEDLASASSSATGTPVTQRDIQLSGGVATHSLIPADFEAAVDFARKNFADSIGAPKIPNVQWSDVGGLANVKDAVVETIQMPLQRPELFASGLKKRSGILFYGPPGTGKTLLAKAIATEFSLNFFSVKGPELLNMYIGESEANVRRVFQRARDARPCVVFFDELDSVAPKRGNQGDSGGVMDRIVSQLLAELDGMSDGGDGGGGVFVIGATNRPDLLDQALLRPGRFDKMLYLGISDTHDKQATILQALTRKYVQNPSLEPIPTASSLTPHPPQQIRPLPYPLPPPRRLAPPLHLHGRRPLRSRLGRHAQSRHAGHANHRFSRRGPQLPLPRRRQAGNQRPLLLRPFRGRSGSGSPG